MTTTSNDSPNVSVLLSREEVLAILHLIGVSAIPGLGDDPIADLSPEQRAFGLIVAERALRARGLAIINEEGHLLVQSAILQMVGTCALPMQSLYVTQVASPNGASTQMIAHQREKAWTLHVPSDLVLHAFALVDSWSAALDEIRRFCQWSDPAPGADFTLTIANETLSTVRELAVNGQIAEARAALLATGNQADAVEVLISVLSQAHIVTVVQRVKTSSPDAIAIQSITTLHCDNMLLVAVEATRVETSSSGTTVIQPVSINRLEQFFNDLIVNTVNVS